MSDEPTSPELGDICPSCGKSYTSIDPSACCTFELAGCREILEKLRPETFKILFPDL